MNFPLHYLWWVLALVLIAGEVLIPGYFLLWIGIGAAVMGVIVLVLPALGVLPQAIGFVVLAFISCILYWRFVRPRLERDAAPDSVLLNRRGARMIVVGRNARRVDQLAIHAVQIETGGQVVARGAGPRRDKRRLPGQRVVQRALAGVGRPD